jgi:Protein of unknown function (DUF1573)
MIWRPRIFGVFQPAALGVLIALALLPLVVFSTPESRFYSLLFGDRATPLIDITPSAQFACRAHRGDVVRAVFTVRNTTDQPLEILGVHLGCGCMSAGTEFPMDLAPAGKGSIIIDLRVGEPNGEGKFLRNAALYVNREGSVPSLFLEVSVLN